MTAETYDNFKQYVGSKDDFADDLLNMGYIKGVRETIEKLLNTPMDSFNGNTLKEVYKYDSNGVFDAGWNYCYENFCEVINHLWQITID